MGFGAHSAASWLDEKLVESARKESAPVDRYKARTKIAPIVLCQWMAGAVKVRRGIAGIVCTRYGCVLSVIQRCGQRII